MRSICIEAAGQLRKPDEEENAPGNREKESSTYTASIEEGINAYIEKVVMCLVNSSWRYTEERAREIIKERYDYIEEAYNAKEPADGCCAEVGYHCG